VRSLRFRLTLALLTVVVLSVGTATGVYLWEVSKGLVTDQAARAATASRLIDADLARLATRLDRQLDEVLDPRGPAAQLAARGSAAQRWSWAASQIEPGRLDILTVLSPEGQVLTSGHWPASLGALDPGVESLRLPPPDDRPVLLMQPVPTGSVPVLARWRSGAWGSSTPVIALTGLALDGEALEGLRTLSGADLVAVCPEAQSCLVSLSGGLTPPSPAFSGSSPQWSSLLRLASPRPGVWIGIDRSALAALQQRVRTRALILGALGVVLALGIGVLLSRRIVAPVEALARAANEVAAGDLHAASRVPPSDITEVQALVSAFQQMGSNIERSREELIQAERVAAWQEIAQGLAHELKNPLTPIQASMDILRRARRLDRPDFDDILDEQAGAVVEEVQRLKELADSFSRFARLPDPRPEPIDLAAMLDGVVSLYAGEGVTVTRDYPPGLSPLLADRTQLQTALTNLIKNAVEACSETERPAALHLAVGTGDPVVISIDDAGPGIASGMAERLFTPYVSTKGSRGTGLGLALVHRIAIEHGGSVLATQSQSLGGARFELRLPVVPVGAGRGGLG